MKRAAPLLIGALVVIAVSTIVLAETLGPAAKPMAPTAVNGPDQREDPVRVGTPLPPGNITEPAQLRSADASANVSSTRPAVIAVIDSAPAVGLLEFSIVGEDPWELLAGELPEDPSPLSAEGFHTKALLTNQWYAISGSRIVGSFFAMPTSNTESFPRTPNGHGTAVASRAIGLTSGACPDCVAVSVNGNYAGVFAWIAQQEWIDAVSVSTALLPYENHAAFMVAVDAAVASGKPVFWSNGNDVDETRPDARRASKAIKVAMTREDGHWSGAMSTPGADIAATGVNVRIIRPDGSNTTNSGTSLSAPWLAGTYGRFLMEQWERGALVREKHDGVVRQRIVDAASVPAKWAADGFFDGSDFLPLLATHARPGEGAQGLEIPFSWDPSFWGGYGVVLDEDLARIVVSEPSSWMDAPARGEGYEHHLVLREQARAVWTLQHEIYCAAAPSQPGICAEAFLRNRDWYKP